MNTQHTESAKANSPKGTGTVTGRTKVWITDAWYGPKEIREDGSAAVGKLGYSDHDMSSHGWSLIGTADITLNLATDDEMVSNKIVSLREEIKSVRGKAEARATQLEQHIQSLLALSNEAEQ